MANRRDEIEAQTLRVGRLDHSEHTGELTGADATMDEAEIGDAGNGADPYGADLSGGMPQPIEDEPDRPDDIVPDQIERFEQSEEAVPDEDRDVTAQPAELPPIDRSELP